MIFDRLSQAIQEKKNPTCAGIDTRIGHVPGAIREKYDCGCARGAADAIWEYNRALIDLLADVVPSVKIQIACYEMYGLPGLETFCKTQDYARQAGLVVIVDAKRNDIASTAEAYANAFLGGAGKPAFDADILTVNPYLGWDGIEPFLKADADRGIFALVKTSNPSSSQLQDLPLADGRTVFEAVGDLVEQWGEGTVGACGYSRVGAVVGATHPQQGAALRSRLLHTFFLLPGYGAQGAGGKDIVGMFDEKGGGAVVNNSRGLIAAWQKSTQAWPDAVRAAALAMQADLAAALGL
ncbi:MAG: orotidine-5'-phosphate decarboxylase [Eubacteriales bacterium]|nr:orotidine-5'-phosphate decarboxylase [Eubacteriales bacterium]